MTSASETKGSISAAVVGLESVLGSVRVYLSPEQLVRRNKCLTERFGSTKVPDYGPVAKSPVVADFTHGPARLVTSPSCMDRRAASPQLCGGLAAEYDQPPRGKPATGSGC
jgi:hypothetical protein